MFDIFSKSRRNWLIVNDWLSVNNCQVAILTNFWLSRTSIKIGSKLCEIIGMFA